MKNLVALVIATLMTLPALAQHDHESMHHATAAGVKMDVRNDEAAQMLTMKLGPLNLPAHSDHMSVAQAPAQVLTIPFDGWITAYHPRLVDDAGQTLPSRMLHHVAFWNTGRSDFLCPNKLEHIFGAGGEMNDWPAQPGLGYRVHAGDRIRVTTMFHNPTEQNYPRTYLEVRIEYQPSSKTQLRSVYPAWFDVQRCGDSGYDLTPGENVTSGDFTLNYTGVLIGVGGHMHDFGRWLDLTDVSRKEEIAKLEAKRDAQGRIIGMPIVTFIERGGFPLQKGDDVKVTANYDNPTGKALPEGAMGIVVGYFIPQNDAEMEKLKRAQ